jgi:hypothetical protein
VDRFCRRPGAAERRRHRYTRIWPLLWDRIIQRYVYLARRTTFGADGNLNSGVAQVVAQWRAVRIQVEKHDRAIAIAAR